MPSSHSLPSTVIDYVQNGSATQHYAASSLSGLGGIIFASRDTLARHVDPDSLQLANQTQAQDAIERSEFKLPNMSSLFIVLGGNALSQVI